MRHIADDTVGHEVGCDSIATQAGHMRPQDTKHLIKELLDKAGRSSHLPNIAALSDEEEVEGPKMMIYPGSRNVTARGYVDTKGSTIGQLKDMISFKLKIPLDVRSKEERRLSGLFEF